jgi:DNA processing protein
MDFPFLLASLSFYCSGFRLQSFVRALSETDDISKIRNYSHSNKVIEFIDRYPNWWQIAEKTLKKLKEAGGNLTYPGHSDYPLSFLGLKDPPLLISYWGHPCWKNQLSLSVVGSRDSRPQATTWMDENLPLFAKNGFVLASGGARGIDQKAHSIAIRQNSPTMVFLPSGLNFMYPKKLHQWQASICDNGGSLISELHPKTEMRPYYFQKRNRMIAAISDLLLVVQARRNSGSMMTAKLALEAGNDIAVLPGFPTDPEWAGNCDLLFDGAYMIRDGQDLLGLLG